MKVLAVNKRASYDYELLERYEAGLVLLGHEVKSVKTGHLSLKGSFVAIKGGEMCLTNAFIPPYPFAGKLPQYDPTRSRPLLLKKSEIRSLIGKIRVQGLTLVPLRMYTRRRLLKLEFAVGKGKKSFDKRASIAKKEARRRIDQSLRAH
jgi:SsrA-binding protein